MACTDESSKTLHVFFIPFLARGHTIPMVDIARLFAQRGGIRCTVVTTPGNSSYILDTIQGSTGVDLELVPFPAAEVGLPVGMECTDALPSRNNKEYLYCHDNLYKGMALLQHPIEKLIVDRRPDCIVADLLLVWTADTARAYSIPVFHFSIISPFSTAVIESAFTSGALQRFSGSDAVGPLPGLPHPLGLIRSDLPSSFPSPDMFEKRREVERNSCGIMFNTFEELMPEYVELCRKVTLIGDPINVWCIGPVHLYKAIDQDAGKISNWLDSKPTESVLYVSFGSECFFSSEQLREIAIGLQSCRHSFIWVVRGGGGGGADTINEWLPQEFYETVGDRGLILTEWAPQVAILNHRATGGYIMHCGWNSCMETVCAGLPVIAWPLHSDHFVSERLVVEVIKTGLRILERAELRSTDPARKGIVKGEAIKAAVDRLMGGEDEEARAVRNNARKYKEMARSAMEEVGSSYGSLSSVIEMMKVLVEGKQQ